VARLGLQQHLLAQRLGTAMLALLGEKQRRLGLACRSLDTVSPLATLKRGYAIVSRLPDRLILRKATAVKPGDRVEARLAEGTLVCIVDPAGLPE